MSAAFPLPFRCLSAANCVPWIPPPASAAVVASAARPRGLGSQAPVLPAAQTVFFVHSVDHNCADSSRILGERVRVCVSRDAGEYRRVLRGASGVPDGTQPRAIAQSAGLDPGGVSISNSIALTPPGSQTTGPPPERVLHGGRLPEHRADAEVRRDPRGDLCRRRPVGRRRRRGRCPSGQHRRRRRCLSAALSAAFP